MIDTRNSARDTAAMDGWHVLGMMAGFFALIFAVNGYFLYAALSTHTGVVSEEPYRKGLAYNARIAADERQAALGWQADVAMGKDGRVELRLHDGAGKPVSGVRVVAMVGRPATKGFDRQLTLAEAELGAYAASVGRFEPGTWTASIEVFDGVTAVPVYRIRRRLWITE
jgi:nitrogen fixation protein FixH